VENLSTVNPEILIEKSLLFFGNRICAYSTSSMCQQSEHVTITTAVFNRTSLQHNYCYHLILLQTIAIEIQAIKICI